MPKIRHVPTSFSEQELRGAERRDHIKAAEAKVQQQCSSNALGFSSSLYQSRSKSVGIEHYLESSRMLATGMPEASQGEEQQLHSGNAAVVH